MRMSSRYVATNRLGSVTMSPAAVTIRTSRFFGRTIQTTGTPASRYQRAFSRSWRSRS